MLNIKIHVLSAVLAFATASPNPAAHPNLPQAVFTGSGDGSEAPHEATGTYGLGDNARDKVMAELMDKYAPVIKLSVEEAFFPSSIEYMLPHFTFADNRNGTSIPLDEDLLTPSHLNQLPNRGVDLFLSIPESHNPQPFLDPDAEYLFGPAGQEGGMDPGDDGRGRVEEPVYGFWVDKGRGVVDLFYWTFYPYNFGKFAGPFGVIGNHVGDWEHLRMRTINGTAVSVDYHAHSGGPRFSGTFRWSDVPKMDGRPVAYCAAGSHGLWPEPGTHELAPLLDLIRVVDVTDDLGPIWDTKGSVVPYKYWHDPQSRSRNVHHGDERWLDFRGMFGNRGENDCWWYKVLPMCQLVDAPPGPNRWFGSPPACTIAPVSSSDTSSYSFYLSQRTVDWAEEMKIKYVQAEQVCIRPKGKDKDLSDSLDDALEEQGGYESEGGDEEVEEDGEMEIWTTTGTSSFHGLSKHHITTMPCKGVKAAVKSYRLSFCLADGKCILTTNERQLCAYEEDRPGYVTARAIHLEDVDDWWIAPSL